MRLVNGVGLWAALRAMLHTCCMMQVVSRFPRWRRTEFQSRAHKQSAGAGYKPRYNSDILDMDNANLLRDFHAMLFKKYRFLLLDLCGLFD